MSCLEKFGATFYQRSLSHAKIMIDMGIWSGVERHRFDNWCDQFETDSEKVILAHLLNKLVYRSKEQVKALLYQALDKGIPQKIYEITGDEAIFSEMKDFLSYSSYPKSTIVVPVIRDSEPPTKSGPLVARLFKKMVGVNDKMMRWPWKLGELSGIKTVIFLDDFVGTGKQFLSFCDRHVDQSIFKKEVTFLYAPITANENGLERIAKEKPFINICPIEVVSDEDHFFNSIEKEYQLTADELTELESYYMDFMKKVKLNKIGSKEGKMVKGYGDLALTYAYEHGTPNGSLPLLWANSDYYMSLFTR